MPAQRRSSLLTERCSLQSLDLVSSMTSLVLDDDDKQACQQSKKQKQEQQQQLPQRQLRRSKRIQELNAKKQDLLLSSPVSTVDTPSSTSTSLNNNDPAGQVMSSSIVTPIKTPSKPAAVRFGINSVAKFSGLDPPMEMERLSPSTSQQLFPRESEDDSSFDEYDDETKQNCHILAQWDSFDELDQLESDDDDDDDESIEADNSREEKIEQRQAELIVEEEEDFFDKNILISPNISHRSKISPPRPKKRVDEYLCKVCGHGVRRTSRYVYEEE